MLIHSSHQLRTLLAIEWWVDQWNGTTNQAVESHQLRDSIQLFISQMNVSCMELWMVSHWDRKTIWFDSICFIPWKMFRPTVTIYLYLAELISFIFVFVFKAVSRRLSLHAQVSRITLLLRKSSVISVSLGFQYTIVFYTQFILRYRILFEC